MSLACAVCLGVVLAGCSVGQSQQDEEKEPHFILGNSRFNAMDYEGARDAFQESLEVNPRSASAHFRLAELFDTKLSDPAAAIYHYQQYLQFNPRADNAEVIRQRINTCKQQLAADVMPLPSTPAAQQQVEKLIEQNRQLQQQVDRLNDVIKQWNAYYASQLAAAQSNSTAIASIGDPVQSSQTPDDISAQPAPMQQTQAQRTTSASERRARTTPTTSSKKGLRAHTVVAGETLASIARKSGVNLNTLLAANPGLSPKHMRVGQVVNIPAP